METLKIVSIKLIFIVGIQAQEYTVSIFGLHAADIVLVRDSISNEFQANNRGVFDLIWPTSNTYKTSFHQNNFSIKNWEKIVRQGSNKIKVSANVTADGFIKYKDQERIRIEDGTKTVFTFLEMAIMVNKDSLDTRWFPYEHQGSLGRARLIWADSSNQWDGKDSILCDHYRFDIEITDSTKQIKSSDYFMNNIARPDCVREIWVSRSYLRRIIAAKATIGPIPVFARIQLDKGT